MDFERIQQISAAGLLVQKSRIEASALNLANINTSIGPGQSGPYPVTAVIRNTHRPFALGTGARSNLDAIPVATLVPVARSEPRLNYDPGHPHADAKGMVSYPGIDHAQEMMNVTTALRSYEANVSVLQVTKVLTTKTLEIGN